MQSVRRMSSKLGHSTSVFSTVSGHSQDPHVVDATMCWRFIHFKQVIVPEMAANCVSVFFWFIVGSVLSFVITRHK